MKKIVTIKQVYNDNELLEENKREIKVYEYKELTESAQEKAWEEMEQDKINNDIGNDQFKMLLDDDIECLFPKSNLKYEYSLNSCQGDGFNLYGDLNLYDMLDKIQDKFNLKELKYLNWLFSEITDTYSLEENFHYTYCICDRQNVLEDALTTMELDCYRDIKYDVITKFESLTKEYLCNLCKHYEDLGYKEIYELSDDDIECYIANGIMFYENGNIYSFC